MGFGSIFRAHLPSNWELFSTRALTQNITENDLVQSHASDSHIYFSDSLSSSFKVKILGLFSDISSVTSSYQLKVNTVKR